MPAAKKVDDSPRARHFSRYHLALLAIVSAVWLWAAIRPLERDDWWLENLLVFIGVPLIVLLGRYFRLSNLSYGLIALFMVLHLVGSHYTYAKVPFGFTLQEWMGSERNLYDRLVHFLFGLLLAYPMREIFVRITRARGVWALYLPVELVIAFSSLYELIEWAVVAVAAPGAGIAFLGAQGDEWDAQKDMALAALGGLLAMTVTLVVLLVLDPKTPSVLRESLRVPADDKPLGEVGIDRLLRRKRRREAGSGD